MRFMLLLLISSSAFACPDLAGTYTCEEHESPSVITQTVSRKVTTYNLDGITAVADGKTRIVASDSEAPELRLTQSWKCSGKKSLVGLTAIYFDGELAMRAKTTFQKTPAGYSATVASEGESESFTCKRVESLE